jgi:hypothetical protein
MTVMKIFLSLVLSFGCTLSFAQNAQFFKGVDFDSSYCVVGIVQGNNQKQDSLPQYWFVLDNPADMIQLKKKWVFTNEAPRISIEFSPIEIYTLRNKMEMIPTALIYPQQGIIKSGNSWYRFDIREIEKLHNKHPLRYHTQTFRFDTYKQCIIFGNSLLNDSNLLFFMPPSMRFEGEFYIYGKRTNDPSSPDWVHSDINKVLKSVADEGTYESARTLNDTFDFTHKDQIRITVSGPKSLYDKFESKDFKKGDWTPSIIEMKVFWRD